MIHSLGIWCLASSQDYCHGTKGQYSHQNTKSGCGRCAGLCPLYRNCAGLCHGRLLGLIFCLMPALKETAMVCFGYMGWF